ncbi:MULTISPECIES: tautomerase family protein [unclassified Rhizobium]|uniref:tautomerase family protein n=1 Tax=unclassified Rhizobium TaxID=2613769 RepID=UPI0016125B9A|nr:MULTISPECIES: tautomerase family protein [unclassified Rhizobium]MBB3387111.1 4-oxalocrotonate tautomerase [Rhizobium sp. BK098]MBB3618800.1 4-oxalocrotonate tautomerase [Rhizobium sp. BK609]MBB3684472.1 4-oxalocrotonate tautomerase [Rhizobium sp. BK612]
MPHVIVKLAAGRSEAKKFGLAEEITRAVTQTLCYGPDAVSVSIEDVAPKDWARHVFTPDITDKADTLYKKPSYKLSDLQS